MENEQGTFTSLVFTTTGGMADECDKYHSRLVELVPNKNGERYSSAISWIRAKVSFAIVRSAILFSGRRPVKIVERGKRKAETGNRKEEAEKSFK